MFSSAKLSPSHYILCCLARRCSKIQTFHLFSPKPCLTGNQPYLDNWNFTSQLEQRPRSPPFQTHIPFWLCAKQPEKTSLSLCFNFCLVFIVWHGDCSGKGKEKKNWVGGEVKFASPQFFSGKIRAAPGSGFTKLTAASVKRAHTQTRRSVCTSSGILYTSWLTEIDKGTYKQGILRH